MTYAQVCVLFLMFVFCTSCGAQNKAALPKENSRSETKDASASRSIYTQYEYTDPTGAALIIQNSFPKGVTKYSGKRQTAAYTLTLPVIAGRHSDTDIALEMKQVRLTNALLGLLLFGCNQANNFSHGQNQTNEAFDAKKSETTGVIALQGPRTSVRTIIQDRKGNIWLASNEGIFRYDGRSFINITNKLSSDRFFSATEDRNGNFWFGTYGSGVYYYDGKSFQHFTTTEGLSVTRFLKFMKIKPGIFGSALRVEQAGTMENLF